MITPCTGRCKIVDNVCVGCGRTGNQIARWIYYSDNERQAIIDKLNMNESRLEFTGKNFELTDSIKNSLNEKMEKVLSHDETARINVVLEELTSHTPDEFRAAGNLTLNSKTYHAEAKTDDMYKSINELSQLLLRDIRKEHRKIEAERRK